MMLRLRLRPTMIEPVSSLLFSYGRQVDWEMETINQSCEQLSLSSDDLEVFTRLLPMCDLTNAHNREKLAHEINKREKADRRAAAQAALLRKVRAQTKSYNQINAYFNVQS